MRDDLHKGAPVPRRWRGLIRHCSRDATWELEGEASAKRVIGAMAKEFSPALLGNVIKALDLPQLSLGPSRNLEALRQKNANSAAVSIFFDHLAFAVSANQHVNNAPALISEAMQVAMNECGERFLRATACHVDRTNPGSTREIIRRMKNSLMKVDVVELANGIARGEPLKTYRPVKTPVQLEENLL